MTTHRPLQSVHIAPLKRTLQRLAAYGDRVPMALDERLRTGVSGDSSVFVPRLPVRPGEMS
jgi:hypothetical protein